MPSIFHIIIEPPSGGRFEHCLKEGTYVLGREEGSADVVIPSPEVSRQHVRLTLKDGLCSVEDLNSTSGTFHTGQPLTEPASLGYPFELHLGTVRVKVAVAEGDDGAEATIIGASATSHPTSTSGGTSTHYTPGKEIAKGGMGSVLEANDRLLGRTVAMKVIRSGVGDSESMRLRFIREATVLARLEHPNIVPIHEMGKDAQGRLFYTMKKVEGRTLQAILDALKTGDATTVKEFTLDRLLNIFRKVCDAMAFAHAKGVIHRDLKPENIMVGKFGEVLVMDWGLAKVLHDIAQMAAEMEQLRQSSLPGNEDASGTQLPTGFQELTDSQLRGSSQNLTMDGAVMGSPQYMPPEQALGKVAELDERSDIFSLGGVLYSILTLRAPVEGRTVVEVLENVKSGNITPPTQFNAGSSSAGGKKLPRGSVKDPKLITPLPHCPGGKVPPALSAVTMKALAFDPDGRYAAVGELAGDIDKYLSGFATSAENLSAAGQFGLFIKRHKGISISAAVTVVLLIAVSAGFMLRVNAEKQTAIQASEAALEQKERALAAEKVARAKEEETREALARSHVALAEAAFRNRDLAGMNKALEDCPEPLRDQTWEYLAAKRDSSLGTLTTDSLKDLSAFLAIPHARGQFLLGGSAPKLVGVNLATRRQTRELDSGLDGNKALTFSADGQRLAVGSREGKTVRLYDWPSKQLLKEFQSQGTAVSKLALNPDGSILAVGYFTQFLEGGVQFLDTGTGEVLWENRGGTPKSILFHPGNQIVALGDRLSRTYRLCDVRTGKVISSNRCHLLSMALSPDGKRLAVGTMMGEVLIVNPNQGSVLAKHRLHQSQVAEVAWTADGSLVTLGGLGDAGGNRWGVGVWDGEDMSRRAFMFGAHTGHPEQTAPNESMSIEPESGYLLTRIGAIQAWQIPSGLEAAKLTNINAEQSWSSGFVSDTLLLSGRTWSMELFDVSEPSRPTPLRLPFQQSHALSASHWATETFATATRIGQDTPFIRLFRMEDGKPVLQWKQDFTPKQWVTEMDFDPSGQLLLAEAIYGMIEIRKVTDGSLVRTLKPPKTIQPRFVEDQNRIVAIQPNKRTDTGAEDRLVLIDGNTGGIILSVTNQVRLEALAVSPDRKQVAVAGAEQMVEIRDARTLEIKSRFRAHDGVITALAFHPTLPLIASGSADGSVKFWDPSSTAMRGQFLGIRGLPVSLAFNPSGRLLSVEGQEGVARLFDVSEINASQTTVPGNDSTIVIKDTQTSPNSSTSGPWIPTQDSGIRPREFKGFKEISRDADYRIEKISEQWMQGAQPDRLLGGGVIKHQFSFHTLEMPDPHIVIRLKSDSRIHALKVVNRPDPNRNNWSRATGLTLWLSSDEKTWRQVWKANKVEDEWLIELPEGPKARYLKLGLQREVEVQPESVLHLKEVVVFGQPETPQTQAQKITPPSSSQNHAKSLSK